MKTLFASPSAPLLILAAFLYVVPAGLADEVQIT
jgi:hypothetical protein